MSRYDNETLSYEAQDQIDEIVEEYGKNPVMNYIMSMWEWE